MALQEALTDKELAKILGRRHIYEILDELYPDKRLTLTKLKDRTKLDIGNLSRTLTKLESYRLIETMNEESKHGKPFRYAKLTKKAQRLIDLFKLETQPDLKVEIEEWQIDELIKIMKNLKISQNLSKMAAQQFQSLCRKDPVYLTSKENVKQFFEEVVVNPNNYEEETGKLLRASILSSFHQLATNEKTMNWASTKLYSQLAQHIENMDEKDEIRIWAARQVGDVARLSPNPSKRGEAEQKLFDLYFVDHTKLASLLCEELKQQLVWLTSKSLFEKVQKKADSPNLTEKAKAEMILEAMLSSFSRPSRVPVLET